MHRAFALAASLFVGCTFNVDSFALDVSSTAPDAPTVIVSDFSGLAHSTGFGVHVAGSATATTPSAVVTVGGLLTAGASRDAIRAGVHIDWPLETTSAGARRFVVGYAGPMLETVWTEDVVLTVPTGTALDLTLDDTSLDIEGVTAPIHAVAESGSIDVRGGGDAMTLEASSGSIAMGGHSGSATCSSGSITLALDGAVVAHATTGSIDGTFGGGGELGTTTGSIDVTLVGALDRDLTLTATTGSIRLHVPTGTSMRVETHTGTGSSHVHVGGVDSGDDFTGTIGSGGFLVRATTDTGSIVIEE